MQTTCVYIKSTMCTNSSGPLQLPTITSDRTLHPQVQKVPCTNIRHKQTPMFN